MYTPEASEAYLQHYREHYERQMSRVCELPGCDRPLFKNITEADRLTEKLFCSARCRVAGHRQRQKAEAAAQAEAEKWQTLRVEMSAWVKEQIAALEPQDK